MEKSQAQLIYERMVLIRQLEEAIAEHYPAGEMRCPTHLSIGQEAVPAAVGAACDNADLAVSTHRCHAHYLGKGGDPRAMVAELYGKVTGCTRGRGGSMHLADESVGFIGSTAIVANSIPIGVGLALAKQLQKRPGVSVIFFGDGATEEGAFYEAANFAAVRRLPVLFVCENNFYSVYSSLKPRQPSDRKIAELARSIGLHAQVGDGNDAANCFKLISDAKKRAVAGEGPQFLELATYRWREHCGPHYDNTLGYRTEEEFKTWKALDPLPRFREYAHKSNLLAETDITTIDEKVSRTVADAFAFAKSSPFPEAGEAFGPIFKERE